MYRVKNSIKVTLAPNRILLKCQPSRTKFWSSASELTQTKEDQFWRWIVNYGEFVKCDRQFCRTVYVISWTVALILSSRKLWIWNTCLYHSKTLLVKQGTFLYEAWPDSAEKRDICNTGILTSGRKSNIVILFIDELLVISESRTLHFFQTVTYLWMGGIRRRE